MIAVPSKAPWFASTTLPVTSPLVGPTPGESQAPLDAALFSAGRLVLRLSDLLTISNALGWLDGDIRWIVRCDRRRESLPPDDDAIQQASEEFRYQWDLLTAEETERWLEQRSLSFEDFQLHCERQAVATSDGADDEPIADLASAAADAGLDDESWRVHVWLAGRVHALARRCAWLLVAAREAGRTLPDIMPGVETWREWEKLLEEQRESSLAGAKATRVMEVDRWPLTRVEVEVTEFSDESMVREAELCLAEKSATLEEIVSGTGATLESFDSLVEDLPSELQELILTLPTGNVRRWIVPDEPPRLVRMLARRDPTLDDHDVREAVGRRLQEDLYGSIERELISWDHPLLRLA